MEEYIASDASSSSKRRRIDAFEENNESDNYNQIDSQENNNNKSDNDNQVDSQENDKSDKTTGLKY